MQMALGRTVATLLMASLSSAGSTEAMACKLLANDCCIYCFVDVNADTD